MGDSHLARKLQIREDRSVLVTDAPRPLLAAIKLAAGGARIVTAGKRRFDVVVAFVVDRSQVKARSSKAVSSLAAGGVLWLAYPKKTGAIATDISRDVGWEPLTARGFQPVSQVSLDGTWSALRFKHDPALAKRRAKRDSALGAASARAADKGPRRASVPDPRELRALLLHNPAARSRWEAMPPSHRSRHRRWIDEAATLETRARRLEKLVGILRRPAD